jgi:hypothetical protein
MRKQLQAFGIVAAIAAFAVPQVSLAQTVAPPGGPAPAQAGDDPSMAPPTRSQQPVLPPEKIDNPESTVGLAPADQPVNNAKPRVAGQVVPSAQETAQHMPSIFEHDRQPTIAHTFNFTNEQKRLIVDALAQEKGVTLSKETVAESVVLPSSVELKPIPDSVTAQMPWVRNYSYAKDGNRIVLVDPYLRFVAAIIE